MSIFKTIYIFFNNFFNMLSFKTNPKKDKMSPKKGNIYYDDDIDSEEFEFLVLNENLMRR